MPQRYPHDPGPTEPATTNPTTADAVPEPAAGTPSGLSGAHPVDPSSVDPARHETPQHESPRHDPDRPVYEHAWEDSLEPRHLINRCDVVLRVGAAMLAAGTGSRRVVETMRQVGRALDLDDIQTRVSLTEVVVTVRRRGITRTQAAEVPDPGINADQIAALQNYSRHLPAHLSVAEVDAGLDAILHRPRRWPAAGPPIGAGLACAAFAYLNHAGVADIAAVFLAAAAGQVVRRSLHRRHVNQLAMAVLVALLSGLVFVALSRLFALVAPGLQGSPDAGLFSSILFLIPGFPLITAALELARLDLPAGIQRLTYAALLTFAAGFGIWTVAGLVGITPGAPVAAAAPTLGVVLLQMLASFVGVFGFAVVFNSPPLVAVVAGAIALVANPLRLHLVLEGWASQNAAAVATLVVGLLAWVLGRAAHLPRIILSVPSVVIMVPGVPAFQSLVYFNDGHALQALDAAMAATTTVLGMVIGLVAARMLTDPQWAFSNPNPPSYTAWVRRFAPHQRPRVPRRPR